MEKEYHKLTIKPINPDINVIEDSQGDCHRLTSKTNTLTVSHREQPSQSTINFILGTYKKGDPGVGVPEGGTTNQILAKKSNDDFDTEWQDPEAATSVIEEIQVNGVPLPIVDKSVNVIVPTQPSDIGAEPANNNIQSHISDTDIHHSSESLANTFEPKNSNIQEHIADETIHHTIEELNDVYEPKNANIQSHISDTTIHHTIEALDLLYADINHNHNLNDLAEKSYNSLTDKPSLNFEPANANIQSHISDATKHIDNTVDFSGTIDETNDKFTLWDNSLLKWIRFSFTSMKTWLSSLYLKLDQSTPQTITASPKITSLTEGQLVYADANNQLQPIDAIYDPLKLQIQIGGFSGYNSNYALTVKKSIRTDADVRVGGANARFTDFGIVLSQNNSVYFKNESKGSLSSFEIWTKNVLCATFTPTQGLKVVSGIQCGDDTAAASLDKLGTRRNRKGIRDGNVGFYVSEECSQKGVDEYEWTEIFRNEWIIP